MKQISIKFLTICLTAGLTMGLISCDDYLNETPKGISIPSTLADYESFIRYEYGMHRFPVTQAEYLMQNLYCSESYQSYYPLYAANYNWDTSIDRVYWNNSDEATFYTGYGVIGTSNLIIEDVMSTSDATEAEQREVWAYAKVLRAMAYFLEANYYADTYNASTASSTLCVPLITSSEVNASYYQATVQEIYDFMLSDVNEALEYLPDEGTTILHPGKGAAYAFLARVYLQMMDYDQALKYANLALAINDELYDWNEFYTAHQSTIEAEDTYTRSTSPWGFDCVENYCFNHGSSSYSGSLVSLPYWRADGFEENDARYLSSWKLRDYGGGTVYLYSILTGYFNYGGMRTPEVYLIKAECQARDGDLDAAMTTLNTVRATRILSDSYEPREASTVAEAIEYIRQTKNNELIGSIMPFADSRRYNSEGTYPVTLSRTVDGVTTTLEPDSYLWTMPFPQGAVDNSGGGTIVQNVDK